MLASLTTFPVNLKSQVSGDASDCNSAACLSSPEIRPSESGPRDCEFWKQEPPNEGCTRLHNVQGNIQMHKLYQWAAATHFLGPSSFSPTFRSESGILSSSSAWNSAWDSSPPLVVLGVGFTWYQHCIPATQLHKRTWPTPAGPCEWCPEVVSWKLNQNIEAEATQRLHKSWWSCIICVHNPFMVSRLPSALCYLLLMLLAAFTSSIMAEAPKTRLPGYWRNETE